MLRRVGLGSIALASLASALPAAAVPSGVTVEFPLPQGTTFEETSLSDNGQMTYRWTFFASEGSGIRTWTAADGLRSIASTGALAPGGGTYTNFGSGLGSSHYGGFVTSDAGHVEFRNATSPITFDGANTGLWGPGAGGQLALLAHANQPLPGDSSGGLVATFPAGPGIPGSLIVNGRALDDAGRSTFGTVFQIGPGGVTSSNDSVLYQSDGAGSGSILAREGDPVPGMAPGTTYTGGFGGYLSPVLTAFRASTTAGSGIFADAGGGIAPLVLTGDAAPGTGGAVFSNIGGGRVDAAGEITFQGTLQSGVAGVTTANDTGFWGHDGAGALQLLAREGDQAPGAPAGALFASFGGFDLDDGGVAFRATLQQGPGGITAASDTGLWRPDDDDMILLAREGEPVPGLPGVTWADFTNTVVAVDEAGNTAFTANLTVGTGGVTALDDRALFFADSNGLLTLLLREGEILPYGPLRTITLAANGFNDAGQILIRAGFEISSSPSSVLDSPVVLTVPIPEPATALLLGLGIALLGAGRHRPRGSAQATPSSLPT